MKNIFKTSKCAIIAILTFCLLFCISGTQVFAAMAEVTEDTPAAIEDTTQELMPMMARSCFSSQPPTQINGWSQHALNQMQARNMNEDYLNSLFTDEKPYWNFNNNSWNYSDGMATICVNSEGIVTTVYWNYG